MQAPTDKWHDERDELLAEIANLRIVVNQERRIYKSIHGELRDVQATLCARDLRIDELLTAIKRVVVATEPHMDTPMGGMWLRAFNAVKDYLRPLVLEEEADGSTEG